MATQYSNKPIVTDGLVYALDFGNPKSYVSGSTTANNLAFEPTISTAITGSVTIPNLQNGVLFFTGSQWVERTGSFNVFNPNGAFTLSIVVNARTAGTLVSQTSSLGNLTSNISPTSSVFGFINPNYNRGIQGLSTTQLNHLTYRYSSGSLDIFYNGTLVTASQANISLPTSSTVDEFYINGTNGLLNNFSGSLAAISVYNRSLTLDQLQQNYTIARIRYGLPEVNYTIDQNAFLFLQSAGITDPIITGSIDTFVRGLKANNLWDKMIAIYPFVGTGSVGTNLTGSHRWNLKEPSLVTFPLTFTGSWIGSTSGSAPSASNTNISVNGITPSQYYPFFNTQSAHISILSYDTPVSSSYLMGTGMTEDLAISTLAGDYGTPAAAYSVRKVRTAYSGALMDVRRSIDNVTSSIGFVSNGDLDTGSLVNFVKAEGENTPGEFDGLAAAYSLRKVSSSYDGPAVDVRRIWDNTTSSIGFDSDGNLDTASLSTFVNVSENLLPYSQDLSKTGSSPLFLEGWASSTSVQATASTVIAPDGTLTGNTLNTTVTSHFIAQRVSGSYQDQEMIFSFWAKTGSMTAANLSAYDITNSTNIIAPTSYYSQITSGEWTYITASFTVPSTCIYFQVYPLRDSGVTGSINIWGAQLRTSSYVDGYVRTTGSKATPGPVVFGTASHSFGYVTQWYDQSGNGRHATQVSSSKQPLIVSSGSLIINNGKPAVRFINSSQTFLKSPSFTTTNPIHNFLYFNAISNGNFVFDGENTNQFRLFIDSSTAMSIYANGGTEPYYSDGTGILNKNYLMSILANGANTRWVINGDTLVTASWGTTTTTGITLGKAGGSGDSYYYNGYLSEFISYNSDQSANRPLIENNINNYYNIYTGSNQGFVARWYDQSGNNRHATQTATGSQPIIVESGSVITDNNRSALTFDGNDFLPFNGSALANTKYSIFFAHSRNSSIPNYILGGNGSTNANLHVGYDGSTSYLLAQYFNDLSGPIPAYTSPILQQFSLINGNSGKAIYYNSSLIASNSDTVNLISYNGSAIGQYFSTLYNGKISEIVMYPTDLTSNREPIEYNINNYYNIYPQTSSFATSSFTIQADSTSISGSLNNKLTSGIQSSGPLGLVTVSRTGSNSLTIARNGVSSSFAVPASGALSTGIYLGAINNNGLALGNSPLNISFASVGTGLSNNESGTLNTLVNNLQFNLGRNYLYDYASNAIAAYSLRRLNPEYNGPALKVRRVSDNETKDIGFVINELDTNALLSFIGNDSGTVEIWYDQSNNNNHVTQTTVSLQPMIISNGVIYSFNNKAGVFFGDANLSLGRSVGAITAATTYTVFSSPIVKQSASVWWTNNSTWWWQNTTGYTSLFSSGRRDGFASPMKTFGQVLFATFHTGSLMQAFQNGISLGSNTAHSFAAGTNLVLGGRGTPPGTHNGPIHELIIYPVYDTGSRIQVESNINAYYKVY
jgi:hypothetical protein